jgi:phosphoribosylamine--glycine ligase
MPSSQDHKPVLDGDKGPNTGGMGAYSPAPVVTEAVERQVVEEIMMPLIRALAEEGRPYTGVLYAGLMIEESRAKVLEFNCRFGDPEAQPLLVRMKSDIVPVLEAVADGDISGVQVEWDPRPAVCVVMASKGYPRSYKKGAAISGLDEAGEVPDTVVFHAGTRKSGDKILTDGGRVLGVTSLGETVSEAITRAYRAVGCINWKGLHYRKDIGLKAMEHRRGKAG